jgi:hypothetical protein
MKKLKLIIGWIKLRVFHVCPKCNSDAPESYDCEICHDGTYPVWRGSYRDLIWEEFRRHLKLK